MVESAVHLLLVEAVQHLDAQLEAREVAVAALHVGNRQPPVVRLAHLCKKMLTQSGVVLESAGRRAPDVYTMCGARPWLCAVGCCAGDVSSS